MSASACLGKIKREKEKERKAKYCGTVKTNRFLSAGFYGSKSRHINCIFREIETNKRICLLKSGKFDVNEMRMEWNKAMDCPGQINQWKAAL